ncbi:reverse transcriptase domain-containing protein, partial [Tanacetum coccineum]
IIREVFVKLLLDSFGKLSIMCLYVMWYAPLLCDQLESFMCNCFVRFMRILRLREVARVTARIALEFAPEFVYVYRLDFVECYLILLVMYFSVSLLLTPLCYDDIHDVTPRVFALAGCDMKSVGYNLKNWSEKLDDALWAFRTAYKTPTGWTPFIFVYEKACHLPVEIEHKLRDEAYGNTRIYKERTKKCIESRLRGDKNFKEGDKVLIFNSRFKMHPGKLKLKWYSPCVVKTMHPYGTIEIIDKNGVSFKVNGHRLKRYHDGYNNAKEKEVVELDD